jgi:prepilin-type N-terminal cleavage/methylation domain-containing protein/prepilin-type processing-associated H-X9-DG protein
MTIRNQKAFTLIELLVVISIIALLMSIMMPGLNKAKEVARNTIDKANLRQWGIIGLSYTTANDDKFPRGCFGPGSAQRTGMWMTAMRPYYADIGDMRLCPVAGKPRKAMGVQDGPVGGGVKTAWGVFSGTEGWSWVVPGEYGSYGINRWLYGPKPDDSTVRRPFNEHWGKSSWPNADMIPMFFDCAWTGTWPNNRKDKLDSPYSCSPQDYMQNGSLAMKDACLDRHQGGIHVVFLDGSVRKVTLKGLWGLKWSKSSDLHNRWTNEEETGDLWPDGFE